MPDAGQLWERALSNFGKDVGEGIKTAEQKLIDIENKPSKGTEDWASAIPVARGTYDADTSTFTGDEKGDYYQLQTPAGKTLHVPIKEYEKQLKKISSPKSPRTLDSDKDEIL